MDFATDVLVDILGLLTPKTRRRHWRHVLVDRRTPTDLRSRDKTLVVAAGSAYVDRRRPISSGKDQRAVGQLPHGTPLPGHERGRYLQRP
ncbi:hypothetical protein D1007_30798 [Hordeum vulgare]|nr:hypothetical protein D1007_30798 [Hordeum vulgare]